MRKLILAIFILFFINSANAVEFKPLEMPKNQAETQNEDINSSKALLNDKDYKFKGRVEYDEKGILFLDSEDVDKLELKVNVPKKHPKNNQSAKERQKRKRWGG